MDKLSTDKTITFEKRPLGMAGSIPPNVEQIDKLTQIPNSALYVLDYIVVEVDRSKKNN